MPDFKFSLSAKPPKPKPKKPGQKKTVVRAGGRGGAGNISRTKKSATPSPPSGLAPVKSNNTTATAATAGTSATHQSTKTGSSAKSLSTLPEEKITNPDYGDNVVSPAGREVGIPRNKTTTSGRGGAGNAHDHVLEEGVFERVIAHEDAVIRQHREMQALKASRKTGRGGAGNIKRSKEDIKKDSSSSVRSGGSGSLNFMVRRMKRGSSSSKSSETTSYGLVRVETQTSMRTTDTYGTPLSPPPPSDKVPDTLQEVSEEGLTDNNEQEEDDVDLERMVAGVRRIKAAGMSIPNGSQGSISRPKEPEMRETRDASGPARSPFRPSPESWANATAEALAHLKATGVIPQVPEIPHSASTSSLPTSGAKSPPPSRAAETQVIEIPASSHFKRVAPGVSLYSPSPTEQTSLTPLSQQFQSQQSSQPVRHYLPEAHSPTPSDRSTELSYRRTREPTQTRHNRNVAIYSPTASSSSDYLAEHEGDGDQRPAPFRLPTRPYRTESDPEYPPTVKRIDPLGDQPRHGGPVRSPNPGPIGNASPHAPHLSATRIHEKQGSLSTDETGIDVARYAFPDAPSHRPVYLPPAPQHIPQTRRKEEPVAVMEGGAQPPRQDYEPRWGHYPLTPPPSGAPQSPGRAPIDSGALYRGQRHWEERDFPSSPREDPRSYGMSSSPAPGSPSAMHTSHRLQGPRARQAARVAHGEDHTFLRSPLSSESHRISPEMDHMRTHNYYYDNTVDRRPSAMADDALQGRQPSSAGPSSNFDRRPSAEHLDYYRPRGFQSNFRALPPMSPPPRETQTPPPPVPPIPSSYRPDERGSRFPGTLEPGHFRAFDDHSSNYSSRPSVRSSIATSVATPYEETSATSTVRSPSRLSTVCDPQDELHDRKQDFASVHAHHAEDDQAFYSNVLGEYHHDEDDIPDPDLFRKRGRDTVLEAVEALNSARSGTPVSNHSSNPNKARGSSNITTPVFKKKFSSIEVPPTAVIPPAIPIGASKMSNANEEAPLHVDELNVPSRKPLSKMEKALLRRVEFGSNVDYSKIQLT